MSEYNCSVCNKREHVSELEIRKIDGIEQLVCNKCIEWNEVERYME